MTRSSEVDSMTQSSEVAHNFLENNVNMHELSKKKSLRKSNLACVLLI